MKTRMRIVLLARAPLADEPKELYWTVWSDRRSPAGWMFRTHDGHERFSLGNWTTLVERVRATADNYGCAARIS